MSSNDPELSVAVAGPRDWRDVRAIRLEALQSEPVAYSASYEETLAWPDEHWRQRLANDQSMVFLARARSRPIGMVGGYLSSDEGDDSVAVVFGTYVTHEYRGRGIGRMLLTSLIHRLSAFPHITTIRLGVTEARSRHAGCTSRWASRSSVRQSTVLSSVIGGTMNSLWNVACARAARRINSMELPRQ